jgi:hypothetical protein
MIYLVMVAAPDFVSIRQIFLGVPRRRRIAELEAAVRENPSAANYEELGDLYTEAGSFDLARATFDKVIAACGDSPDTLYRRALCALRLGDPAAAIPDLEKVVSKEPNHDFNRAGGLLAQAHAQAGQTEKAEALFLKAIAGSTLSETYLNYADLLAKTGRHDEARQWIKKVLDKELTMPSYLRRRERPWFQRANELWKQLPA